MHETLIVNSVIAVDVTRISVNIDFSANRFPNFLYYQEDPYRAAMSDDRVRCCRFLPHYMRPDNNFFICKSVCLRFILLFFRKMKRKLQKHMLCSDMWRIPT